MHREKKQRESVIFPRRCKIQKIPLKNRFWIDFWMEVGGIEIGFDGTFRDSAEIRFLPLPLRFLSSSIIEAMMIEKASPPSPLSLYIYIYSFHLDKNRGRDRVGSRFNCEGG